MNLLQLNTPIPMNTPKGKGYALVMIDYGMDFDILWVIALDENGEIWTFSNQDVRAVKNVTFHRNYDYIPNCS